MVEQRSPKPLMRVRFLLLLPTTTETTRGISGRFFHRVGRKAFAFAWMEATLPFLLDEVVGKIRTNEAEVSPFSPKRLRPARIPFEASCAPRFKAKSGGNARIEARAALTISPKRRIFTPDDLGQFHDNAFCYAAARGPFDFGHLPPWRRLERTLPQMGVVLFLLLWLRGHSL